MTNNITINHKDATIEINKKFEKAASCFGSREYADLQVVRTDYPTYRLVVKGNTKKRDGFRGLTVDYMKSYIEKKLRARAEEIKKANETDVKNEYEAVKENFFTLCGWDEEGNKQEFAAVASYGEIKKWFLEQFPEFKEQRDRINEILGKKVA